MRYFRSNKLALLLVCGVSTLEGCYTFTPTAVASSTPQPTVVRAHLSDTARERLWAVVPSYRRYLDGQLIRVEADSLLLEVSIQGTEGSGTFRQRIPVARSEIVSLQTRQLDRTKTYMVAGVFTAAALGLIARVLTGKAGGGGYPPDGGGPTESIMTGLRSVR